VKVTEVFRSIQGEGPGTGRLAVFLRLSGCNLHCEKCDSKYSWKNDQQFSTPDLLTSLRRNGLDEAEYLVITGGEPLLQRWSIELLLRAIPITCKIGIETNGTKFHILNTYSPGRAWRDIEYVVSPKLSSFSSRFDKIGFNVKWAKPMEDMDVYFKFVAGSQDDLDEIGEFVKKYDISRRAVWIMPECVDRERHLELFPQLWKYCMTHGYNLSSRLHILTFGNIRGV